MVGLSGGLHRRREVDGRGGPRAGTSLQPLSRERESAWQ